MRLINFYLLCLSGITLTLTAPQYVDPYATTLPQFSQLSSTNSEQGVRIWPWIIGQYGNQNYPSNSQWGTNTQQYGNIPQWSATYNNNPTSSGFAYNPYNLYSSNIGTTYWNGNAWVNSKK